MEALNEKLTVGEPLSTEELLNCLPALREVPAAQLRFAEGAAVRRTFQPGEIVCNEGDFGSTAFYIVSGEVDIFIANPLAHIQSQARTGQGFFGGLISRMNSVLGVGGIDRNTSSRNFIGIDASVDLPMLKPLAILGEGELFGEMTCRTFQPRSATVMARTECVMVEILRVVLDLLVGTRQIDATTAGKVKMPTFKGTSFKLELDRKYRERSLSNHLRSVPLFSTLEEDFVRYLCERVELVSYNKGDIICRQGDPADAFYLIRLGMVRVAENLAGGEMVRTYLGRGDFFGEIGLITQQNRTATCSALDAVDVVRIKAADFEVMLEQYPEIRSQIESVAQSRLEESQNQLLRSTGLRLEEFLDQGLFEAQNLLVIDLEKCTRCDACVQACSEAHDGVSRLLRDGLRYDKYLVATACRSCRDPLCMTQCPVGSIRRKDSLEILIEDWCIGCSKCADLCPYGNINMHPVTDNESHTGLFSLPSFFQREAVSPLEAARANTAARVAAPVPTGRSPRSTPDTVPSPKPLPLSAQPLPAAKPATKKSALKATTCDLCTELTTPSCVYACPHDAAKRVEPAEYFAQNVARTREARSAKTFLRQSNRTTHRLP
jgi:CRP-like cAMP-binding protein/Fe-S-cluster-containing hydrogenase component 2